MKKAFYFLLLFVSSISFLSCDDDDKKTTNPIDQLPPATQTGKNTFGCLINGKPFIVRNTSDQVAIYQQGQLQFGAEGIYILANSPLIVNTSYSLVDSASYIIHQENGPPLCYYDFEDTFEGFVKFSKIDQTNYIISGSFEFSTVNEECDTIKITNGRFDMKYIP